jgi:hypothetical protein
MVSHSAYAGDPIEDILSMRVSEFTVTQEKLYQDFVGFVFKRDCAEQYPFVLKRMTEMNPKNPMDAWVSELNGRNSEFLNLIKGCQKVDHVLNVCDQFVLKVPEFFAKETLVLVEMYLRNPDLAESLDQRIATIDAKIQEDLERDYTPEKLLARFEKIGSVADFTDMFPSAPKKARRNGCTAKGCTRRVLSRELNPFACNYCEGNFCGEHRYLTAHNCPGQKEKHDQEIAKLRKENPVVIARKVNQI